MPFVEARHSHEGKEEPLGTSGQRSKISGKISEEEAAEALERDEPGPGCAVCSR